MNEVVKIVSEMQPYAGEDDQLTREELIESNKFRNHPKKVEDLWSIEKILKSFEELKSISFIALNNNKGNQNVNLD